SLMASSRRAGSYGGQGFSDVVAARKASAAARLIGARLPHLAAEAELRRVRSARPPPRYGPGPPGARAGSRAGIFNAKARRRKGAKGQEKWISFLAFLRLCAFALIFFTVGLASAARARAQLPADAEHRAGRGGGNP